MFKSLKEKLKNWTKKISEKKEKEAEEEIKKEDEEVIESEADLEDETEEKEIEIPKEFNVGMQKYEPDLERVKEIEEQIEKKEEKFLGKLGRKISTTKITEGEIGKYGEELEMLLLENNVALEVVEEIVKKLKEEMAGRELSKGETEPEIKNTLKKIIEEILIEPFDIREKIKLKDEKPFVILLCGINGTGKTTTIAKITAYLKKENMSCVLAAGDTFRAASIEQLKKHGEKLETPVVFQQYGSDPAAVGFDAIKYAKKNKVDCVLIDTAGRMHTSKNLMNEIEKVVRVCDPDIKIFVGESITGNDATEQAKAFNEKVGIDGIILTKADTDEKGGTSLSVGYVTKKPILFLGTGQGYDDIEIFDKKKFIAELELD